jgi:putative membrane protein
VARPLFTDAELETIRQAVSEAERATAGEIVPFVVQRSGRYEFAVWRGAALGALLAALGGLSVAATYSGWGLSWLYAAEGLLALVFVGAVVGGGLVAFVPALRRALAGAARLDENVGRRAAAAFLEEEVFNTRDRTGILLFVSLLEHRILVVGDAGINQKVGQEEWAEVVARIRRGIREKTLAAGLVDAVGLCGALLHRRGVEIRPDDTDELADGVRIRPE